MVSYFRMDQVEKRHTTTTTGPLFNPGDVFKGYVVERALGSGASGTVWLVRHEFLDTLFALKTMAAGHGDGKSERAKRFVREAKLASRIKHPNLAEVHDAGYDPERGLYYLVMDYVEGDTLRTAIALGGPMEENLAVGTILQVCDVLALAGRFGMVHRDLKPENVIIARNGSAMLLDFGIAKAAKRLDSLVTMANTVFGTPSYIAPEQAADSSAVSPSADVYSLGIMLFEMLAGRTPWTGKSPIEIMVEVTSPEEIPDVRTLAPSVSAETAGILRRMCMKKAEDRLQSADAVIDEFAKCGHTAKINSGRNAAAEETEESMDALLAKYGNVDAEGDGPAPARRSRLPWLVIAIVAVIAAAAAFFLLVTP